MATCLLVHVPELPLRMEHLLPQEELALAAAELRDEFVRADLPGVA